MSQVLMVLSGQASICVLFKVLAAESLPGPTALLLPTTPQQP